MASPSLEVECLDQLREYITSLGGDFGGEWKCRAQVRDYGSRAGSVDTWFTSPMGDVYRSKVAAARGLGLDPSRGTNTKRPKAPRKSGAKGGGAPGSGGDGSTNEVDKDKDKDKDTKEEKKGKEKEKGSKASGKEEKTATAGDKPGNGNLNGGNNNNAAGAGDKATGGANDNLKWPGGAAPSGRPVDLSMQEIGELLLSMPAATDCDDCYEGPLFYKEAQLRHAAKLAAKAAAAAAAAEAAAREAEDIAAAEAASLADAEARAKREKERRRRGSALAAADEEGLPPADGSAAEPNGLQADGQEMDVEMEDAAVEPLPTEEGSPMEKDNNNNSGGEENENEEEEEEEEEEQHVNYHRKSRGSRRNTRHSLAAAVAAAAAVLRAHSGTELPPGLAVAAADAAGMLDENGEEIAAPIGPPQLDHWDVELEVIRKCFVKVPVRLGRPLEDEPVPMSPTSRGDELTDALLALSDGEQQGVGDKPRDGAASIASWQTKRFPLDQLTANDGEPTALHPAALFYLRHLEEEVAAEERALKREAEERAARKEAKRLEKQAAMAGGADGVPRPALPKPANLSLRGKSIEEVEEALMERLSTYVTDLGGILPDGWRVKASIRQNGANAGGVDAYYYDPTGRRHKSMVKVAEVLGLEATAAAKPKTLASILGTATGKRGRAALEEAQNGGDGNGGEGSAAAAAVANGDNNAGGSGEGQLATGEGNQGTGEGAEGTPSSPGGTTGPSTGVKGSDRSSPLGDGECEDPGSARKTCGNCRTCLNPQLKKGCLVNRATKKGSDKKANRNSKPAAERSPSASPPPPPKKLTARQIAKMERLKREAEAKEAARVEAEAEEAALAAATAAERAALGHQESEQEEEEAPPIPGAAIEGSAEEAGPAVEVVVVPMVEEVEVAAAHVEEVPSVAVTVEPASEPRPKKRAKQPIVYADDSEEESYAEVGLPPSFGKKLTARQAAKIERLKREAEAREKARASEEAGEEFEESEGMEEMNEEAVEEPLLPSFPGAMLVDENIDLVPWEGPTNLGFSAMPELVPVPIVPAPAVVETAPAALPVVEQLPVEAPVAIFEAATEEFFAASAEPEPVAFSEFIVPGGAAAAAVEPLDLPAISIAIPASAPAEPMFMPAAEEAPEVAVAMNVDAEPSDNDDGSSDGEDDAAPGAAGASKKSGKRGSSGGASKASGQSSGGGGSKRNRNEATTGGGGSGNGGGGGGSDDDGDEDGDDRRDKRPKQDKGEGHGADAAVPYPRRERKQPAPIYSPGAPAVDEAKKKKEAEKAARREKRKLRDNDTVRNSYDKAYNRLKGQLSRLRQEQALVEAYAADGWRGASREKVKPVAEIKRAKEQIQRCKEVIRECVKVCDEAEGDTSIPAELFDSDGELDLDHIFCAKCKGNESTDDNDIIMCDGHCNRAYHVKCLVPPVDPATLPEDEGWLCPSCDRKIDMIDDINDEFGTEYEYETPWEQVLAPGTIPTSPGNINGDVGGPGSPRGAPVDLGRLEGLLAGADLPSDDEEDEDYAISGSDEDLEGDQDQDEDDGGDDGGGTSGRDGSKSEISVRVPGGRTNARTGSGSDSGSESDDESDSDSSLASEDLGGEILDVELTAEEEAALAKRYAQVESSDNDDSTGKLIVQGKRRRTAVDYRALNQEMFGDEETPEVAALLGEEPEEEDEDEGWSPRAQARKARLERLKRKKEDDEQSDSNSDSENDDSGEQQEEEEEEEEDAGDAKEGGSEEKEAGEED